MKKNKNFLFYPSGHGFGHLVRQTEIIKEIIKYNILNNTNHNIFIRTSASEIIFQKSIYHYFQYFYPKYLDKIKTWLKFFKVHTDIGTIQKDSLTMDITKTYEKAYEFYCINFKEIIVSEVEFIVSNKIDIIIGDIPPLAFEAAFKTKRPSIAITNFSWDFIYEEFIKENNKFKEIITIIQEAYSKCNLLLKLPYSCPLNVFNQFLDVNMICRIPYLTKENVLSILNLDHNKFKNKLCIMISFGGFDTKNIKISNLNKYNNYTFLTTIPPNNTNYPNNVIFIDTLNVNLSFENLFTIFDIIITKPGYGVVGDILGANSMCIYTDRGNFKEYDYLVKLLQNHCKSSVYIPQNDLYECNFENKINEVLINSNNKTKPLDINGAKQCADIIINY